MKWIKLIVAVFAFHAILACQSQQTNDKKVMDTINNDNLDTAILAGGCFWCMDAVYRRMEGIVNSKCGYSNGKTKNPSYKEVCTGTTGHAEVIELTFDTSITSFAEILEVFWRVHNPTTLNRQGNDIGTQYRSAIFYVNETQKKQAELSIKAVEESKLWTEPVVTEVLELSNFWEAEDYHQDYFTNNPNESYCVYVVGEKVEKFKKLFKEKLKTGY